VNRYKGNIDGNERAGKDASTPACAMIKGEDREYVVRRKGLADTCHRNIFSRRSVAYAKKESPRKVDVMR